MKFLVINGPNLNMLGSREPDVYGKNDYSSLVSRIEASAKSMNVDVECVQSNYEGAIVEFIQKAKGVYDGLVINPGAYTHYSVAILDALKAVNMPAVEVHISNIHKREEFRHKSVTVMGCDGQICGLGVFGYIAAIGYLIEKLQNQK